MRVASRILVFDRSERALLVGARLLDLDTPPAEVLWWYTPGGGVDPGEPLRDAEEIGLLVTAADLEGPV